MDEESNAYRSRIYLTDVEAGTTRPLTAGPRDTAPRWSPDGGWLAFLSRRDGGALEAAQLYLLPLRGGEAQRITGLKHGAGPAVWSPDGRRIAFVARIDPRRGLEEAGPDDEDDLYRKYNRDVRIITRLRYKFDGEGFFGDLRRHLVVLEVDPATGEVGAPRLLTCGDFDVAWPAWSPDGRWLVFAGNLDPDADFTRATYIYRVPAEGGEPERLTGLAGPIEALTWAPDGAAIAFLGHDNAYGNYTNTRLWLVSPEPGATPRCLTAGFDRSLGDQSLTDLRAAGQAVVPVWLADGSGLVVQASDAGSTQLWLVRLDGHVTVLTQGEHVVSEFSGDAAGRRIAAVVADPLNPGDIHVLDLEPGATTAAAAAGGALRRLTRLNEDFLAELRLSRPEPFRFRSGDVWVDGWVLPPVDREPGRRYPTVLQIHGGPMAMYAHVFFHEFQLLAARGYAVVYTNPRGSQGYGQEFCCCIRGDWGNLDYQDVMNGLRAALDRYDFLDPDRLGVAGGSYGGFMVNWIIGHDATTFKAAVSMRSVVNRYSSFGTADTVFLRVDEYGGTPWEVPERYLQQSPISHIAGARTPTLIIHSEMDLRCPVEQGEQLFVALKLLGVETEFVRFPGESHGLSRSGKPWHRVFRLDRIVDWFDRHLRGAGA